MSTVAYAAGFILIAWGALHGMNYQFVAAGVVVGALGTAFCSIAVRCPKCGAYPDASDQYCIFCGETLLPELQSA